MAEPLVRKNGIIAGVCAATAHKFGMSETLVRVLYVVLSIVSAAFPGILAGHGASWTWDGSPRIGRRNRFYESS